MFKTILENKSKIEKLHTAQYNVVFVNCISTKIFKLGKHIIQQTDVNMGNSPAKYNNLNLYLVLYKNDLY